MSGITIEKADEKKLEQMGVKNRPIWTKEASTFDWHYDETEVCYVLEGEVVVRTGAGEVRFGRADLVTFPKGLDCEWKILKDVRKHYRFG